MVTWKFNPDNYNESGFKPIPEGSYRVRIESALERTSRTGKEMVELELAVSGHSTKIWFYLVFDSSDERMTQMTDQRLGSIYNSFDIERGDLHFENWEGKTGGAYIRQRADNNGSMRNEISYFLPRKKVDNLPAWIESGQKAVQSEVQDAVINPEMASFEDTNETFGAGIF